jgi:hypothetical protein
MPSLEDDIALAEEMMDGFFPADCRDTAAAWKVWHALNSWRSQSQWFLDRKDPNWKPTVRDSKHRTLPG